MASPYHSGEIAVQERVGGRRQGEATGRSIRDHIPSAAREFLLQLPFVVIGALDEQGEMWATYLAGEPGFVRSRGDREVVIEGGVLPGEPLAETLRSVGRSIGMIGIEPSTRSRIRLNGRITGVDGKAVTLSVAEVYANCPKYIQARDFKPTPPSDHGQIRSSDQLDPIQRSWLESADTFYIATAHPEGGADCSHRGGMPGFVQVHDEKRLSFPDYAGNFMFQTLGNLESDPRAGLLFADFESGTIVHLSGTVRVDWSPERRSDFERAERVVDFNVERVIERPGVLPITGTFLEYSKFNPGGGGDMSVPRGNAMSWTRE